MCKSMNSKMFMYDVFVYVDVSDHSKTPGSCSNAIKKIQRCWNLFLINLNLKRCVKTLLKSLCLE